MVWLLFTKEIWMFYLFAIFFGLAYGVIVPLFTMVPVEFFGLQSLGGILSVLLIMGTAGGAIGPPLTGSIFDANKRYHWAWVISIIVATSASLLSLILLRHKPKEK